MFWNSCLLMIAISMAKSKINKTKRIFLFFTLVLGVIFSLFTLINLYIVVMTTIVLSASFYLRIFEPFLIALLIWYVVLTLLSLIPWLIFYLHKKKDWNLRKRQYYLAISKLVCFTICYILIWLLSSNFLLGHYN